MKTPPTEPIPSVPRVLASIEIELVVMARYMQILSDDICTELAAIGQDVERRVLARAVRWHAEHRVLLDGHRTVVFR